MPLDDRRGRGVGAVQLCGLSASREIQTVRFEGYAFVDTVVVCDGVLFVAAAYAELGNDRQD